MKNQTPSWDDLRMLLAVHRDKSFLAAGKTLGVAASTVARRIDTLERTVGRPVVHRTTDGARLDPDALRLVALAEELELGLASLVRDGRETPASGTVRVSLAEGFIRPAVGILSRLRVKHPELHIELISESRLADLGRGEADIGLRIVRSTSPALISKLIGRAAIGLVASREYVERRLPGAKLPRSSAGTQDFVGLDSSLDRLPQQKWLYAYGAERFVFRSNSATAIEHALLAGMGVGLMSEAQAKAFPGLVLLDLEDSPPHVDVYLAFHKDAKKVPRVRTVVKELEAEIRRQLG
jgi:DNA-binding transcriptional LysR family regulator